MSDRYPGGIITKTPVTPAGPYAEGSAPGVWTLEQQAYWKAQGLWPQAGNPTPNDPYFQYVTSLLHGDGTNGGQNNTFLDSSSNAFTITRNGNTTQGSFSPYGSNWGNYFNGSSAYLTLASNSAFDLGSSDFTVEAWCYPQSTSNGIVITRAANGSTYPTFELTIYSGTWRFYSSDTSSHYNVSLNSGIAPFLNQWQHVAVTRNGSTYTIWINGTAAATTTSSASLYANSNTVGIGAYPDNTNKYTGYISNLRLVSGTAVYTSAFTPSTTPLTAISGTQLLTCQSNRFIDNSSNAFAITVGGTPQVTRFSPFAPTISTQYSTSTIGGSGYFGGDGNYLNSTLTGQSIGSGNFTIECWLYSNSSVGDPGLFHLGPSTSPSNDGVGIFLKSATKQPALVYDGTYTVGSIAIALNTWNHIAVVRSGSTITLYVNGVSSTSVSSSTNFTDTTLLVGAYYDATTYGMEGYISNFRYVKGTAVYTTTFTPPTSPVTAISGTQFLCNMTNAAIYDNSMIPNYETVGSAAINTSTKKYGTGSIAFNGSTSKLVAPYNTSMDFGTGNFTIEMWINFGVAITSQTDNAGIVVYRAAALENTSLNMRCRSAGNISIQLGATDSSFTWAPTAGVWYHLAISRVGSSVKMFVNGTQTGGTSTNSGNVAYESGYVTTIGGNPSGSYFFNGYIDDLRITKGYARYWENFTPPTAALPNFGGAYQVPTQDPQFNYTTLLLPGNGTNGAQNNTFLDSSTNAFTITRNGNTTQGTFTPFSQTGWGNSFDGVGDYLTVPSNTAINVGTGAFTFEGWMYRDGSLSNADWRMYGVSTGNGGFFGGRSTYKLGLGRSGVAWDLESGTNVYVDNQWTHVVYVRDSSGNIAIFSNGLRVASASGNSNNYGLDTGDLRIGNEKTGQYFGGYFSNLRLVKGTAVYDPTQPTLTVPTTNLTAISGTGLLTAQSNRFVDNSSNGFTITPTGDVKVQAFSPFAPTAAYSASTVGGSGYFDGTGDYLTTSSTQIIPTGSFTIEAWVYTTNTNSTTKYIVAQGSSGNSGRTGLGIESSAWWFQVGDDYVNSGTPVLGQWNYVAMTFNGSTLQGYVNGVSQGSISHSGNAQNTTLSVGTNWNSAVWNGYISSVRISNTVRTVTSVPTAPFSNDANTTFLANYTNAGITDATAKNDLETVGNAQISTAQAKFGSTSIAFDGNGDVLSVWSAPKLFNLGTGDFTLEMWINFTSTQSCHIFATNDGVGNDSPTGYYFFSYEGGVIYSAKGGGGAGNFISMSWTPTTGQWYHMAVSRTSSEMMLFINGQKQSVSTTGSPQTFNFVGDNHATIGVGVSSNYFDGYIQDLRLTKGYARYVQPFTPPTQAFQLY